MPEWPDSAGFRLAAFVAGLAAVCAAERLFPFRRATVGVLRRRVNNLSLAALNALVLNLVFAGLVVAVAADADVAAGGLLNRRELPAPLRMVLTVLALDLALYVWHVLNHAVPLLWRFHRVHHSDMDVDGSTAVRFHIGELAGSTVVKAGLISYLGASLTAVVVFEAVTVTAAQFHHGNFRLPALLERCLRLLVVSPSMHRVHHSTRVEQTNSNYGTLLSLWDRLFGTFRPEVPAPDIELGLREFRGERTVRLADLLVMPLACVPVAVGPSAAVDAAPLPAAARRAAPAVESGEIGPVHAGVALSGRP